MFIFDPRDKRPIYEQMCKQLRQQIALGVLTANEPLPSVRQVAVEMGINPNTVQKAYRMMEAEGLTYSIPGKGSFVTGDIHEERKKMQQTLLQQLEKHISDARDAGLTQEELLKLVASVYERSDAPC